MRDVAVITGSGGVGCGHALAQRFARAGYLVVVSDIDDTRGRETVERIEAQGHRADYQHADVRAQPDVDALLDLAQRHGALRVLVNNASAPFHPEDPFAYWNDPLQTDLLGAIYASRKAVEMMNGKGAIVNMTSISALWHGRSGRYGSPAYEVAKAGLLRFTTAFAPFAASRGVRINAFAPGWIGVPEVQTYYDSLTPQQRIENEVPSRLLTLDEVCDAVYQLATDSTLNGRIMQWWSEDPRPNLIAWRDRGYRRSEPVEDG